MNRILSIVLGSLLILAVACNQPAAPDYEREAEHIAQVASLEQQKQELFAKVGRLESELAEIASKRDGFRQLAVEYADRIVTLENAAKRVAAAPVCTTGACAPRQQSPPFQYYYVPQPRASAWYPGKRLFGGR